MEVFGASAVDVLKAQSYVAGSLVLFTAIMYVVLSNDGAAVVVVVVVVT